MAFTYDIFSILTLSASTNIENPGYQGNFDRISYAKVKRRRFFFVATDLYLFLLYSFFVKITELRESLPKRDYSTEYRCIHF